MDERSGLLWSSLPAGELAPGGLAGPPAAGTQSTGPVSDRAGRGVEDIAGLAGASVEPVAGKGLPGLAGAGRDSDTEPAPNSDGKRSRFARRPWLGRVAVVVAVSLAAVVGGYGAYRAGRAVYVERVRPHDYDPATLDVLATQLNYYLGGASSRRQVECFHKDALRGVEIPDDAHVDEIRNRVIVLTYQGDQTLDDTMEVITGSYRNLGTEEQRAQWRADQAGYVFEPGMVVYEEPPPFPSAHECAPIGKP